jgi:hypothetical protein
MSYIGHVTDHFCHELEKLLDRSYRAGVNGEDIVYARRCALAGVESRFVPVPVHIE